MNKRMLNVSILALGLLLPAQAISAADLVSSMAEAYKHNPVLKSQIEQLRSTNELMPQALSGYLPTASFNYDRGKQKTEVNNRSELDESTTSKSFTINQPLFRGGKTWMTTKRARNQILAAREDFRQEEQEVLFQAVTAFMNVLRDQEVLELNKNNEQVLRKHLQISEERFNLGEVTRTDVEQAKSRLSAAIADRIRAEGQLASSKANYKRIVGIDITTATMPASLPEIPDSLEKVQELALQYNPSLKAAEYKVEAANSDVWVSGADLLPRVGLSATKATEEGTLISGGGTYDSQEITLNVSVPIFQSGSEYSRVRQAKRVAQKDKFNLSDLRNNVAEVAVKSWQDYQVARSVITSTTDAVSAAEIALEGVEQEAEVGARTTLDVLDAEQELFARKVDLVRAQRDEVVALHNVRRTIGNLTAKDMGLPVDVYDVKSDYDSVKYQFIGF